MNLSAAQRKYLVREHIIGAALVNGVINALLAWLTFRHHPRVPMQGDPSLLNDVIATSLGLPLFICLIATPLVRKAVRAGKAQPLAAASAASTMILWLPTSALLRGVVLAAAALSTFAPMLLGLLLVIGVNGMSVMTFATIKFFYAGILAALVSPIVALHVMARQQLLATAALSET